MRQSRKSKARGTERFAPTPGFQSYAYAERQRDRCDLTGKGRAGILAPSEHTRENLGTSVFSSAK